jgi:hypothetical protein
MNRDSGSLEAVFVPDILTPGQYYDSKRPDNGDVPVKRLMIAVLQDAFRCFQVGAHAKSGSKVQSFYEVQEWLFGESREGPFSFQSVCDVLGIAPEYLRKGLAALLRPGVAGSRKPRLGRRSPVLGSSRISSLPKKIGQRIEGPPA